MKSLKSLSLLIICFLSLQGMAQVNNKIYKPEANAKADLEKAINQAHNQNKHVLIQIGGNWCPWCLKFHDFINKDIQIDSIIKSSYIFILINYSKENKNLDLLKELEFPQRFGFPVLVVLDEKGKRIHTQNSAYLEEDKGYSKKKVKEFLEQWSPKALEASNYEK